MILHKVSTSPFCNQSLQQCLKYKLPTDKLLLIQDAVYAINKTDISETLLTHGPIYVLNEDVQARGLNVNRKLFQAISYSEFVDLTLECKQMISW